MIPLIARATAWLASITAGDPFVADAATMDNLRRLRWLVLVIIPLNLIHVVVFWFAVSGDTPAHMAWKNAIGWTHLCMAM